VDKLLMPLDGYQLMRRLFLMIMRSSRGSSVVHLLSKLIICRLQCNQENIK